MYVRYVKKQGLILVWFMSENKVMKLMCANIFNRKQERDVSQ